MFVIAVVGEIGIELFQPEFARSGYLMNVAIPLTVNLLLVGATIRGRVGFRNYELSKTKSPARFFITMAAAFVLVNGITLFAMLNHWYLQP